MVPLFAACAVWMPAAADPSSVTWSITNLVAPNAVRLGSVARGTTAVDAEIVAAVGAATALATVRLSGPASASLVYAVPAELFHACAVSTSAPFGKLVVSMVAEAVVESGDT